MQSKEMGATRPRLQQGFGLLEAGLLVLLLGGALVAGFVALKTRENSALRVQNLGVLAEVDRQLVSFASLYHRLPCPDLNRDGYEDLGAAGNACATGAQKGWLPYKTLGVDEAGVHRGAQQLMYMVQRGAHDLAAAASDSWRPLAYRNETVGYTRTPGRVFAPLNVGTPDFCQRVQQAGSVPLLAASHAHVDATPKRPVAYALVHPGQGLGLSAFDQANANLGNFQVEPPEKSWVPGVYDDQVRVRTASQLAAALDCDRLLPSIDQVSLGAEVVEEVNSQKITNTLVATVQTGVQTVKGGIAVVKLVKAGIQIGTASGYMALATAELAAATAGCVVVVGCFALPHALASMTAAAVSMAASIVATLATGVSMYATIAAGVLTATAAIMAGASIPVGFDFTKAKEEVLAAWNKTKKATADAQAERDKAVAAESSLLADKNNKVSNLYSVVRSVVADRNAAGNADVNYPSDMLDPYVVAVIDKANAWTSKVKMLGLAKEALDNAKKLTSGGAADTSAILAELQKEIDKETDADKKAKMIAAMDAIRDGIAQSSSNAAQISSIDAQLAEIQTQVDAFNGQMDALTQQIAAETNADKKSQLITERAAITSRRDELQRQKTALYSQKLSLTTTVAGAQTNYDSALADAAQGKTHFEDAYNTLIDRSRIKYLVETCTTTTKDKVTTTTCTTREYTYDGSGRVRSALEALFEHFGGAQWDGPYFRWWAAGEKATLASSFLAQSQDAEAKAKAAYETITTLTNGATTADPPPVVWDGWKPVLQKADAKGGIR